MPLALSKRVTACISLGGGISSTHKQTAIRLKESIMAFVSKEQMWVKNAHAQNAVLSAAAAEF